MDHILRCHEIVMPGPVKGQGCYVWDEYGKRYLDFEAGTWCTALGHNHPRINQVIQKQMNRIMNLGARYVSPLAETAALAVLDILDFPDGKCAFLSSGSEAVELGVQAARRLSGKPLLLTFSNSYLAAYGSAGRKPAGEWYVLDWTTIVDNAHPDDYDLECQQLKDIPFEDIGGLVLEPGSTSGLVKFPPRSLVRFLADRIRQNQGLVVVNEVTTGMGRTGRWFGFNYYDLQPDIVAIGKGLGNGYPVSATALRWNVAQRLEASDFHHAQSHQNDPLGCAVAMEVIRLMQEEGLVDRAQVVGQRFMQALAGLPGVKEVRGRGLLIGLELEVEHASASQVYRQLLERGFIVGYNATANLLRFYPPLTISEEDIGLLVDTLDELLNIFCKSSADPHSR